MRVGVISDIHANAVALEAVLQDMPDVSALICAGDVIGYNPWPAECIAELREQDIPTVMGNHDRMLASGGNFRGNRMASAGIEYARQEVTGEHRAWLEDLPAERILFDGQVRLVHGHPDDPNRYTYPSEFLPTLLGDEPVLIMGHTHIQHHETLSEGIIMNPGSVGQPRDGDPRAAYAVLDLEAMDVDERRVPYDIDAVREAIGEAGLPDRTGARLAEGR